MLKRLNAAKWYILVGIFAYIIFLLVNLPVSVALKGIQQVMPKLPVQISQANGTLWTGNAVLSQPHIGRTQVAWDIQLSSLLAGQAELDLTVNSPKIQLQTSVNASQTQITLSDTKGSVSAAMINQFIRAQGAQMSGDISIDQLDLELGLDPKMAKAAQGQLVWQGGEVKYRVGRNKRSTTMPMIIGRLKEEEGQLILGLHEEDGTQIANAFVKPDGWAGAKIKRRLVDLAGEKIPGNSAPDTDIFELSEKIF